MIAFWDSETATWLLKQGVDNQFVSVHSEENMNISIFHMKADLSDHYHQKSGGVTDTVIFFSFSFEDRNDQYLPLGNRR